MIEPINLEELQAELDRLGAIPDEGEGHTSQELVTIWKSNPRSVLRIINDCVKAGLCMVTRKRQKRIDGVPTLKTAYKFVSLKPKKKGKR